MARKKVKRRPIYRRSRKMNHLRDPLKLAAGLVAVSIGVQALRVLR